VSDVRTTPTTAERVKTYREEHQCSMQKAASEIAREGALEQVAKAEMLADLKPILDDLIRRIIR